MQSLLVLTKVVLTNACLEMVTQFMRISQWVLPCANYQNLQEINSPDPFSLVSVKHLKRKFLLTLYGSVQIFTPVWS